MQYDCLEDYLKKKTDFNYYRGRDYYFRFEIVFSILERKHLEAD